MLRGNRQADFRTVRPVTAPAPAATLESLWAKLPRTEGGFVTIDYRRETPPDDVAFALWLDNGGVHVLVRAATGSTGGVRTLKPGEEGQISYADSLEIMLDPLHNHMDYLWIHWAAGGKRRAAKKQVCEFSLRCDFAKKEEGLPNEPWTLQEEMADDAWYSLVVLPLDMPGMEGAAESATWGFNLVQRRWIGRRLFEPAWSLPAMRTHAPWDFGEVLLKPSALAVRDLDFGEVYHDWNVLRVNVENTSGATAEATARVRSHCPTLESKAEKPLSLAPGETRQVELRFELDSREWRRQDIVFALDEGGQRTYKAQFAAGHNPRHGGACLILKHGVRWFDSPPPRNPDPGTPDFPAAKRRYVLWHLPDFPEPGWWGGPQRDWILRDRRSPLEVNLLADDAFEQLGDAVAERFGTDADRVVAATMLVHRLMIYSPTGRNFAQFLNPIGALRQAATICSGFTCVAHGLFSALPRMDGGRGYESLYAAAHHHTIISVKVDGLWTLVDPTLGAFHYTRDHLRLASVEELVADPELAEGTILGRREDYAGAMARSLAWYPTLPYPPLTPTGEGEMKP